MLFKATASPIFEWDQELEKYIQVDRVDCLSLTNKMRHGEIPWGSSPYYYVVEGEFDGYYPLPLIYAGAEERQRSAMENDVNPPSEEYVKRVRKRIGEFICRGEMRFNKRIGWKVGFDHYKRITSLNIPFKGLVFNFSDLDDMIAEILRKRGSEALFDIIEEYGFGLFFSQPIFGITFDETDLVGWNDYDSSYEQQVYKFAAYCCAKRAEETKEDVGISEYGIVEDFIDELRARLAQVEDACENIE